MSELERPLIAVDLFSGAGGLTEGLMAAGIDVPVAVERHPHAALTHAFNHPSTTVLCGDIRKLQRARIAGIVRQKFGTERVDIVVGGPPCQGFSSAGRRRASDPRNSLVDEFVRIVDILRPKVFLFENVAGILRMSNGKVVRRLLSTLGTMGYNFPEEVVRAESLKDWPLLDAVCYGVPQRRKRFILIGWRGKLKNGFCWPQITHTVAGQNSGVDTARAVTVEEAISDLNFLTNGHECHAYRSVVQNRFQASRRLNTKMLFNHLATKHRAETIRMFRKIGLGKTIGSVREEDRSGKQRMRRLKASDPSWTVLALPDDYIHFSRHRILTVREMARLQSFDDDYVFFGKRTTSDLNRRVDVPQYTQVGNAVPPLLAQALGRSIVEALGGESKDRRDLNERRNRHEGVVGSSAFEGYLLTNSVADKIDIGSLDGKEFTLRISEDGEAVRGVASGNSVSRWTRAA